MYKAHRVIDVLSILIYKKLYSTYAFLDVPQTFDWVWHERLLFKLKKFFPLPLFLLIKSYLTATDTNSVPIALKLPEFLK